MCEHQHIITMLDPQQTRIDPPSSNQVKTNVNSNSDCDREQSRAFEAVRKLAIEKLSAMVASLHQVGLGVSSIVLVLHEFPISF